MGRNMKKTIKNTYIASISNQGYLYLGILFSLQVVLGYFLVVSSFFYSSKLWKHFSFIFLCYHISLCYIYHILLYFYLFGIKKFFSELCQKYSVGIIAFLYLVFNFLYICRWKLFSIFSYRHKISSKSDMVGGL